MRLKKIVSSLENPLVKRAVALQHKKFRAEYKQCLVEGLRAITTCLQAGWSLEQIFILEEMLLELPEHFDAYNVVVVSDGLMKKMSRMVTPAGILAIFYTPIPARLNTLEPGLVLAQLQDPGNAGTLIRTAAALGLKTVVFVESVDSWSPKVIQASAGTIALVNVYTISWQELVAHKGNSKLCALVVSGGKSITTGTHNRLFVIGSEAHGLPQTWLEQCDELITLPMPGGTESLNAAVAGSIALYVAYLQQL